MNKEHLLIIMSSNIAFREKDPSGSGPKLRKSIPKSPTIWDFNLYKDCNCDYDLYLKELQKQSKFYDITISSYSSSSPKE